jgi:hypothetical protein
MMTEFHAEISQRAARAVQSLRNAQEAGDDYLVAVREAELEGLARLATEHGLRVPDLARYSAA